MYFAQSRQDLDDIDKAIEANLCAMQTRPGDTAEMPVSVTINGGTSGAAPTSVKFTISRNEVTAGWGGKVPYYVAHTHKAMPNGSEPFKGYPALYPSIALHSAALAYGGVLPNGFWEWTSTTAKPSRRLMGMLRELAVDKPLLSGPEYSSQLIDIIRQFERALEAILRDAVRVTYIHRIIGCDLASAGEVSARKEAWTYHFDGVDWQAIVAGAMLTGLIPLSPSSSGMLQRPVDRPTTPEAFLKWCVGLVQPTDIYTLHESRYWPADLDRCWDNSWPDSHKSMRISVVQRNADRVLDWVKGLMMLRALSLIHISEPTRPY